VYHQALTPTQIAGLSSLVAACASQGDVVAEGLMDQAAVELAGLVGSVYAQLHAGRSAVPLALAGGLLASSPDMRARLAQHLAGQECAFEPIRTVSEPVTGAIRLALAAYRPLA
jgi:N-acetylglucosamine kinase-like BadF-type ATPase